MLVLKGKNVSGGYALGNIVFLNNSSNKAVKRVINDIEAEISRFEVAKDNTLIQLETLYEKALETVGEEEAFIFQIHSMMLDDEDYLEFIKSEIRSKKINAEYAVYLGIDFLKNLLDESGDEYISERINDVKDISSRLTSNLSGGNQSSSYILDKPSIIAADDLTPSETISLDKSKILAIIIAKGSEMSHTAILAKTMNIPALVSVGVDLNDSLHGMVAAVDCDNSEIILEPDENTISTIVTKQNKLADEELVYEKFRGKETFTGDGKKIHLYSNAANIADVESAVNGDAEGIGLFRSEFLYLEKSVAPTEDEQFEIYKAAAEKMNGKRVIIRTLDAGADKHIPYLNTTDEENPALGCRGVRICLTQPEILKTQLRALLRAQVYGNISIMVPMINRVEEIRAVKEYLESTRVELLSEGFKVKDKTEFGIMIETPAAAITSDILADEVDFFSIGTNDLSQYTMAIDRQNHNLDQFVDKHHESILRLIEITVKNAHKKGIWAGICGELASDPLLLDRFMKMGVDELSMAPSYILKLRKSISEFRS